MTWQVQLLSGLLLCLEMDPNWHAGGSGNALIISYGPAEVHFTVEQLQQQWASKRMKVRPSLPLS